MAVRILNCDVMDGLRQLEDESVHCVVTDPPYGETSLAWDRAPQGWLQALRRVLRKDGSAWIFGSLKSHIATDWTGWRIAQDVVWEKHNGSSSAADRFRRVHEIAVHIYREDAQWGQVYNKPLMTNDAREKQVRRKKRPPHWGNIGAASYRSEDGGPRHARSVMCVPSCHGYAEHPTQKPLAILTPLIQVSCPPGGLVLDPFIGSGSTALAAIECGCSCIGFEISEDYAAIADSRLNGDLVAAAQQRALEVSA